jgi:ankyrin repeat protein
MNARPAIPVIFRPVREGDVDEAARLLDAEPHLLEARDSWWNYCTPIMIAAEEGHVGVVRLLLERGADVNASNKDSHPTFPFLAGCTALLLGALEGHEEVVSVLLGSGADITRKNRDGGTVLWMACRFASTGVVLELLQHMQGVGLDERDDEGCTALWYACYWGNVEIVRALVLAGADHTIANHRGRTTRGEAEWGEYDECVEVLEVSSMVAHCHAISTRESLYTYVHMGC